MKNRFTPRRVPRRSSAEAGAWLARLHRSGRTPAVDAALKQWLAEHPEHRDAFEIGDELLERAATLPITRAVGPVASRPRTAPEVFTRLAVLCGALAAVALLGVVAYWLQLPELSTRTGEQLTRILDDGTRVTLNTQTRLSVQFDEQVRRVVLESGEALFDVTKNPARPFVVRAGEQEVTALGTQFVVRYDERQMAVTLMEGKVSVAQVVAERSTAAHGALMPTVLRPGDRVTYAAEHAPQLDRPPLERVVAWKRGQVSFSKTPLAEAIVEMNRYSTRALVLGETELGRLRVSGLFKVGDSENFALALANTYPIQLDERDGKIILLLESDTNNPKY